VKDFSRQGFQIRFSPPEVRAIYTGFLLFAAVGYVSLVAIAFTRVGPGYQQIVEHYRGAGDGDLFPRPVGQMLEELHFHAFIEGIMLLVLTHLFVATSVNRSFKRIVVLLAFAATFADLASPWLTRFVAPGFAMLQMVSWVGMTGAAAVLIWVPVYDMWWKGDKR
jgi:hypothetical protein